MRDEDFSIVFVPGSSPSLEGSHRQGLLERLAPGDELAPGRAFLLDDPARVWVVAEGRLDLFVVRMSGGVPCDRRHLAEIPAGGLAWGVGRSDDGESAILAVAARDALVRASSPEAVWAVALDPGLRPEVAWAIDRWVWALGPVLAVDDLPGGWRELARGEPVDLSPGRWVRAGAKTLWLERADGLRLLGDEALPALSGQFVVPPHTALLAVAATRALATSTVVALASSAGAAKALDALHRVVLARISAERVATARHELERLRARADAERDGVAATVHELASVLDGDARAARPAQPGGDALYGAVKIVCDAMGVAIRAPLAGQARARRDPMRLVARHAGLRVRQVTLRGAWWRADAGPLVGFSGPDRKPVALVRDGRGRYRVRDPAAPETDAWGERVTAEVASRLQPFALTFYRRLPDRVLGAADLVVFGLAGARRDVGAVALAGLATGVLAAVPPIATGVLFDTVIPTASRGQLASVCAGLAVCAVAATLFELTRGYAILRIEARTGTALQAALWDRLLDLPAGFFRRYLAGDLAQRASGIDTIRRAMTSSTLSTLFSSVFAVFSAALLFYYDASLAVSACGLVLIALVVTAASGVRQLRIQRRLVGREGAIGGLVLQFVLGIAKLRTAGAERRAFARWAHAFAEQRRLALETRAPLRVFHSVFPIVAMMVLFLQIGTDRRLPSAGAFIAFLAAFTGLLGTTLAACQSTLALLGLAPVWERLKPILETLPESHGGRPDPGELNGDIEIAHVSFRYRPDAPLALDDISLRIRPGEFVAVVGASGSGKSTLLRLLLGFERPSAGTIHYSGQDLAAIDVREVRRQLGVVLQSSKLMTGSILSNIVGGSNLTAADALEAAKMAGLDNDIEQLPMGLSTLITDGGANLSGGQRQRLLVAQALVRKPRILFFDEATSALDNRTQAIVSGSIQRLEATRVVIAHRLSTIENADRIIMMDRGRIVESGTYAELLEQGGLFATFARRQLA